MSHPTIQELIQKISFSNEIHYLTIQHVKLHSDGDRYLSLESSELWQLMLICVHFLVSIFLSFDDAITMADWI